MTLNIIDFTPDRILFFCDLFSYEIKPEIRDQIIKSEIIHIDPNNWQVGKWLFAIHRNVVKIIPISNRVVAIVGGDETMKPVLENLDIDSNISEQLVMRLTLANNQIAERLKLAIDQIKVSWNAFIGTVTKHGIELCRVKSYSGKVEIQHFTPYRVILNAFADFNIEFDRYYDKYVSATTDQDKKMVFQDFFNSLSKQYNGNVGGKMVAAKLSKDGFEWI